MFGQAGADPSVKVIGPAQFKFEQIEEEGEIGYPIRTLVMYRKDEGGWKKLLSHTLDERSGDHNSIAIELGSYKVEGNKVIFYSYWAKAGDAPASPYGARKQVYRVENATAKVRFYEASLSIDTGPMSMESEKTQGGSAYLTTVIRTEQERGWFRDYIRLVEQNYGGDFVYGEDAFELKQEVRASMKDRIAEATKDWEKEEAFRSFGIYK